MTAHVILPNGATTGAVKRRRRGATHYQTEPGCAVRGLPEPIVARYPVCRGYPMGGPRPTTKTERRQRKGGLP